MYSFVYNKSWNCLAPENAKSLVYIYTNSYVVHQRLGANPICWYDANVFLKDFVLDALGLILVGKPNHAFDMM